MNLFGSNSTKRFDQNETELDDIRVLSFVSREREPGFDDCPEYSYDSDNENTSQNDCHETHGSDDAHGSLQAYILGKKYHPVHDYTLRREDEISLFWFTYRCDFPEIKPYRIQSDAGWGCMLRSAQMMLCQVLRLHYKSRTWRPPKSLAARRQDPFVSRLMTWFADFPSTTECFYSFQNMVAAGLNYDKLPGEWYGPGTVSFVIRDLVAIHDQQRQELDKTLFRVHVASQGTVYRDEVRRLMIQGANTAAALTKGGTASRPGAAHPLDHAAWEEDHLEKVPDWDTALLLLIPLRLGLKTFNLDYVRALAHTFSLPQSVGVLGGRPRGARYFYGAFSDGSKIFGLDPHTVQAAPQRASVSINGELSSMIDLSDENLRSIHTAYPESISLEKMDPSITLGFYCENERDLQFIFESVQQWKTENPGSPELFTTANYSPDYAANISSTMKKIMLSSSSLLDTEEDQISDEDDYVML
ncbi:cysteine protease ATG4 [Fistulifera solaris]|uniref:Cysteine protease n=1 Tax=Fistulifera solaris TaxID=1519565 RepID=A0A1Z5KQR4_FISSO|nr:cysteine protease ATG4 [Fistulifera solaris]|eukprot:GAX28432.1 cysteine protease ATG4 [Fistulifera solaris]